MSDYFILWDNEDGTYSLETEDIDAIVQTWSLEELKELFQFQIDKENYEGATLLQKAIDRKENGKKAEGNSKGN